MNRTWMDNADEFAALARQGKDLRLAILVACSVEYRPVGRPLRGKEYAKCSAREFAARSNTHHHRITRHLEAWDSMANEGLCESSNHLLPHHANDVVVREPMQRAWQALNLAKVREAAKEAATIAARPSLRVVGDDALEALRLMLGPVRRNAELVRGQLAKLREHERDAARAELADIAAMFDAMANAVDERRRTG